jgi:3-oxoacyl-(acyl-carrier-protein) synthase
MGASGAVELSILLKDQKKNRIRGIKNNSSSDVRILSQDITRNLNGELVLLNGSGMGNVFCSIIIRIH